MATLLWPNGSTNIPEVGSEYGARKPIDTNGDGRPDTSNFHRGIDLVGFSAIKSPVDGVVTFAGWHWAGGNLLHIQAVNGTRCELWHNASLKVVKGQRVTAGQDVAVMGDTGQADGVHCHYEIHPAGGAAVNPRTYYAEAKAASTQAPTPIPLPEINQENEMFSARIGRRAPIAGWGDEWMLVHPSLQHDTDQNQVGYLVATDPAVFQSWLTLVKPGAAATDASLDFNLPRDQYIKLQAVARKLRAYSTT